METKVRWIIEKLSQSGANTKKEIRDYFKNLTIDGINELLNDLANIAYIMDNYNFKTIQDFHNAYDKRLEEKGKEICLNESKKQTEKNG